MIRKLLCFLGWHDYNGLVRADKNKPFQVISQGWNHITVIQNLAVGCQHCGRIKR